MLGASPLARQADYSTYEAKGRRTAKAGWERREGLRKGGEGGAASHSFFYSSLMVLETDREVKFSLFPGGYVLMIVGSVTIILLLFFRGVLLLSF